MGDKVTKVQTFMGKANLDGLHQMDDHINAWLRRHKVTPIHVNQSFGSERHHGGNEEPVVVISIWYEKEEEDLEAARRAETLFLPYGRGKMPPRKETLGNGERKRPKQLTA